MRIGVILASSQANKSSLLFHAVQKYTSGSESINFGCREDDQEKYSYVEISLLVGLLLTSGAVDFIVTGCSSGQGMMLACNSFPGVLCGYVPTPMDAWLFAQINNGNAVSLPLGEEYTWTGCENMERTIEKLAENAKRVAAAGGEEAKKNFIARMGKKNADIPACADEILELTGRCILCERLNTAMDRYVYTLLYMYRHEAEFRKALAASKGFCLDHYAQVMKAAPQHLSGKELNELIETITKSELENLNRVEKDLEWFTLKFDYRNRDKPWGNSQDAVERSVNKMRGGAV